MLKKFRKCYPLAIKLWEPYFINRYFKTYHKTYAEQEGFMAFAGSTLCSQHYMNSVTEHLAALRISCELQAPFKEKVVLLCQENPLFEGGVVWGEELFNRDNYKKLLTENVIASAVLHALEAGVRSVKRNLEEGPEAFKFVLNQFVIGFRDPQDSMKFCLYEYLMTPEIVDSMWTIKVNQRRVGVNDLVVLGMSFQFGASARQTYAAHPDDAEEALIDFTRSAINTVKQSGGSGIDEPVYWWRLDNVRLKACRIAQPG